MGSIGARTDDTLETILSFQVENVELVDKRGYLTVSLTIAKEGKLLLRKPERIRDWFQLLKVKAGRKILSYDQALGRQTSLTPQP